MYHNRRRHTCCQELTCSDAVALYTEVLQDTRVTSSGEAAAAAVKFFSFATVSLPMAWILLTGSVISGMSGFWPDDLIVVT